MQLDEWNCWKTYRRLVYSFKVSIHHYPIIVSRCRSCINLDLLASVFICLVWYRCGFLHLSLCSTALGTPQRWPNDPCVAFRLWRHHDITPLLKDFSFEYEPSKTIGVFFLYWQSEISGMPMRCCLYQNPSKSWWICKMFGWIRRANLCGKRLWMILTVDLKSPAELGKTDWGTFLLKVNDKSHSFFSRRCIGRYLKDEKSNPQHAFDDLFEGNLLQNLLTPFQSCLVEMFGRGRWWFFLPVVVACCVWLLHFTPPWRVRCQQL